MLALPALWNTVYCVGIGLTRQLYAMSRSGYVPLWLSSMCHGVPRYAHALVGLSGLLLSVLVWFSDTPPWYRQVLFHTTTLLALVNALVQFGAFLVFRVLRQHRKGPFVNPLGMPSALVGLGCFGLCLVSVLVYTPVRESVAALQCICGLLTLPTVCFVLYSRHHLRYSREEANALMQVMRSAGHRSRGWRWVKYVCCCGPCTRYAQIQPNQIHAFTHHHSVRRLKRLASVRRYRSRTLPAVTASVPVPSRVDVVTRQPSLLRAITSVRPVLQHACFTPVLQPDLPGLYL